MQAKRAVPRERVLVVGVDERAVDVEDRGGCAHGSLAVLAELADEAEHEPQADEQRSGGGDGHDGGRPAEEHVGDEQHGAVHREGQAGEPDEGELGGDREEPGLVALAEHEAVVGGRRDEERRCGGGRQQRHEVHVALEFGDLREALLEGHREQEREEHLHARHRDAQLAEQLVELAVEALGLGFLVRRPGRCRRRRPSGLFMPRRGARRTRRSRGVAACCGGGWVRGRVGALSRRRAVVVGERAALKAVCEAGSGRRTVQGRPLAYLVCLPTQRRQDRVRRAPAVAGRVRSRRAGGGVSNTYRPARGIRHTHRGLTGWPLASAQLRPAASWALRRRPRAGARSPGG